MIYAGNGNFLLETAHTTYAFCVDPAGNLQHLYYGEKLSLGDSWQKALEALKMRIFNPNGCSIIQDPMHPAVSLDDVCLEVSGRGKGDMAQPFVELTYPDGSRTSDFRFRNFEIMEKQAPEGLPGAYDETENAQSLVLHMEDRNGAVRLTLVYSVLEDCDCITRFAVVKNEGSAPVTLERLMSTQLDLRTRGKQKILSFHGEWAREMQPCETLLQSGSFQIESTTGFSSNKANPFSDMYALEGADLILNNIERACDDSSAMAEKNRMQMAAYYGGLAITASGTTAVHALSYPLGGKYHIAHGVSNAILLAPVMRFNAQDPAFRERLALLYDRCCHEKAKASTVDEKSAWMIARMESIVKHLDIPTSLTEFNVPKEDLEGLVEAGMQVQRLLVNNMRKVTPEDARAIYKEIL